MSRRHPEAARGCAVTAARSANLMMSAETLKRKGEHAKGKRMFVGLRLEVQRPPIASSTLRGRYYILLSVPCQVRAFSQCARFLVRSTKGLSTFTQYSLNSKISTLEFFFSSQAAVISPASGESISATQVPPKSDMSTWISSLMRRHQPHYILKSGRRCSTSIQSSLSYQAARLQTLLEVAGRLQR